MNINTLFKKLEAQTRGESTHAVFQNSGMLNKSNELDYGFFPLGSGILDNEEKNAIESNFPENGLMILGHDFGTYEYLQNKCPNRRESERNPTIRNLKTKLNLNTKSTFFTNYYLGVRTEGTNTNRVVPLQKEYEVLCHDFFIKQLNFINPKTIICLGQAVRDALIKQSDLFSKWKPKSVSLKKLYSDEKDPLFSIDIKDEEYGNRRFIIIPHPCDTRNFNDFFIEKILSAIID